MKNRLVLLQQDLRLKDNPALYWACEQAPGAVYAFYGFCKTSRGWFGQNLKKNFLLKKILQDLRQRLQERGIPFETMHFPDLEAYVSYLGKWLTDHQVDAIYVNASHIPEERWVVQQLKNQLRHIQVNQYQGNTLFALGSILNQQGECFKKFTPFARHARERLLSGGVSCLPICRSVSLSGAGQTEPPWKEIFQEWKTQPCDPRFPTTESSAQTQLDEFLLRKVSNYAVARDFPGVEGCSYLSAHLSLGILSVRAVVAQLLTHRSMALTSTTGSDGGSVWLNELLWREFYRHLVFATPRLFQKREGWLEWTHSIEWNHDEEKLSAWKAGRTGFPLIDAAMHQLNALGWMHNRLRMIVASFLSKQLGLDWRVGEDYFLAALIDADWANNNGGWQWSASTGTDAQPYFRIFNPTLQIKRWDPEGKFVRHWIPSLKQRPWAELCKPVVPGYIQPIVENGLAVQEAKIRFEKAKNACLKQT